jgi:two-component system, sensor histidine kinase and response regulator
MLPHMVSTQKDSKSSDYVKPPLAFLPLTIGMKKGMAFSESSRLIAQNAGAWLMVAFGGLFVLLNALQGSVEFVGLNFAFISAGAMSLSLAAAGFHRTAMVLLSVGSCMVFFFAALIFHNGMENYLLVTMVASLFLLDRPWTRLALAGLNGAAFLYVKVSMPDVDIAILDNYRYGLNILLFVIALSGVIEFFRVLNSDYLSSLEQANRRLNAANRAKEKLFSVIAHDLRGPVGNLKASLDMLESGALGPDEFQSLVSDLAFDVDKSYACLENLLSWSAAQMSGISAVPTNLHLREEVDAIARLSSFAIDGKSLKFENNVPPEAVVFLDHQHLQAILRNLLSNAVKFTPVGGRIAVSATASSGMWTMAFSDSGIGMAPDKAASLFGTDSVASTLGTEAEKGLGLGLEICRQFVSLNSGTISCESQVGVGTKISVSMPAGELP